MLGLKIGKPAALAENEEEDPEITAAAAARAANRAAANAAAAAAQRSAELAAGVNRNNLGNVVIRRPRHGPYGVPPNMRNRNNNYNTEVEINAWNVPLNSPAFGRAALRNEDERYANTGEHVQYLTVPERMNLSAFNRPRATPDPGLVTSPALPTPARFANTPGSRRRRRKTRRSRRSKSRRSRR